MQILVVDDDADVRITTCMLLEHFGHTVQTASDGEKALAAAAEIRPDVVLLDLNMPVLDGFATARRLRDSPAFAPILIVAVSRYVGDKVWCERALAAGVDECLGKPMDYEKLAGLLCGRRAS